VSLHVVILSEIERLAHGAHVTFCEERANVCLKTRHFSHRASQPGLFASPSTFADYHRYFVSVDVNADAIASLQEPFPPVREQIGHPGASAEEPALGR
jgi:hypothetical protein